MDAVTARLRAGEARVTTPAGTDVRFRIGDRLVNRETGDALKTVAARGGSASIVIWSCLPGSCAARHSSRA